MQPYYESGGIAIYHGDAMETLPQVEGVFDVVVTDPPYSFGLASTADEGKAGSWADLMNTSRWYAEWLRMVRERTTRNAAAWVFNSWRSFPVLARAACYALRGGRTVRVDCTAKASAVTGLGQGGVLLTLPKLSTITDEEFVKIVEYWLTNTDLVKGDVRRRLVDRIHKLCREIRGYNGPKSRRLVMEETP
jgi:hypothetical protein